MSTFAWWCYAFLLAFMLSPLIVTGAILLCALLRELGES